MLFGDLKSSTEVVCQLLEETIQTVANGGLTLHTLIHTFHLETELPQVVLGSLGQKCELRDVISTMLTPL